MGNPRSGLYQHHEVALEAVEQLERLVPHTLAETFAVLSGMRPPYRSPVAQARETLRNLRAATRRSISRATRRGPWRWRNAPSDLEEPYTTPWSRGLPRAGAALATLDSRSQAIYLAADVRFATTVPTSTPPPPRGTPAPGVDSSVPSAVSQQYSHLLLRPVVNRVRVIINSTGPPIIPFSCTSLFDFSN